MHTLETSTLHATRPSAAALAEIEHDLEAGGTSAEAFDESYDYDDVSSDLDGLGFSAGGLSEGWDA